MEWQWFKQHSIAFKTVKKYLTESPVLKYYDVRDDVTIQCDAFETGLGTILTQSRQAISYARPRKLSINSATVRNLTSRYSKVIPTAKKQSSKMPKTTFYRLQTIR